MQSQKLKGIQDDIENGILNLESLLDTSDSLARSYERHARKSLKDWDALDDDIMQAFREKSRLAALIKHNFYALREKGNSTANLVSFFGLWLQDSSFCFSTLEFPRFKLRRTRKGTRKAPWKKAKV